MTLYVTDLDGTLLRSDTSLSEYTVNTINRLSAKGVMFTYATARSFASAYPLVKRLDLNCPAVTFNGVFVIDPRNGEKLIKNVYSERSASLAAKFFIKQNIPPLVYSFINGEERISYLESRLENIKGYIEARRGDKRLRPVDNFNALFDGEVFYYTVINPGDVSALDKVFTSKNGFARNIQKDTYDDYIWYEIYNSTVSKANAVLQVKELVGADELVCFGDNLNDISMIRAADTGAAVSNACDRLKALADVIIDSNNNDGVAKYIEHCEELHRS